MKMKKGFKVGDLVRVKDGYVPYTITNKKAGLMRVVKVYSRRDTIFPFPSMTVMLLKGQHKGKCFDVHSSYFTLASRKRIVNLSMLQEWTYSELVKNHYLKKSKEIGRSFRLDSIRRKLIFKPEYIAVRCQRLSYEDFNKLIEAFSDR